MSLVARIRDSRFWPMLWKEFIQIRRDRLTLGMILVLPAAQLMLFGYAIQTDVRHLPTVVLDESRTSESRALVTTLMNSGAFDAAGTDPDAEITFVATPVLSLADQVKRALAETAGLVTDVGSVKAPIAASVDDPRFIGGHPMAGSELEGLDGADPTMFQGAVWVLAPGTTTADSTFAGVAAVVADLGAEVVALSPERHDQTVAVISHVPHLTAATLMGLASDRAEEHAALLRLAAGGFRDMTRIASGQPNIWLDICAENRTAILSALDGLIDGLQQMRNVVDTDNRADLLRRLTKAREARSNLPLRNAQPSEFAEVRIPIPDRPGSAAELFTLAAELGVNVSSFEVVHHADGNRGVAVVLVDVERAELYKGGLIARGFRPSVQRLS